MYLETINKVNQRNVVSWAFYRGYNGINPKNKITDLYLSFSLSSLINHMPSMRAALYQERESLACRALYQVGMDSFDIAGDQLPWLFVEEGKEGYALTRNNTVITFDSDNNEYSLDDPIALNQLRKHMGFSNTKNTLRLVVSNHIDESSNGSDQLSEIKCYRLSPLDNVE